MRCPVCGSKMKENKCKYCLNVTAESVFGASNAEAKNQRKKGTTENIVYSSTLPKDINKKKLYILTIFLGWFGVHNFYVGKNTKGWFCLTPMLLILLASGISIFHPSEILTSAMFVLGYICAIVVMLWFTDIVNLALKRFKVPVVLPDNFEKDFKTINLKQNNAKKQQK